MFAGRKPILQLCHPRCHVGAGLLTPNEAQTISAIVAKRAELFASIELAVEIDALGAARRGVVVSSGGSW